VGVEDGPEAKTKKIRNLQKKIRQISALKDKRDQTGEDTGQASVLSVAF